MYCVFSIIKCAPIAAASRAASKPTPACMVQQKPNYINAAPAQPAKSLLGRGHFTVVHSHASGCSHHSLRIACLNRLQALRRNTSVKHLQLWDATQLYFMASHSPAARLCTAMRPQIAHLAPF
jgi:hypothetical protein